MKRIQKFSLKLTINAYIKISKIKPYVAISDTWNYLIGVMFILYIL